MKNFAAKYFICVIFIFMALAFGALFQNKIIKLFTDEKIIDNVEPETIEINWQELYPFEGSSLKIESNEDLNIFEKINKYVHGKTELYTTEKIPIYNKIIETARQYENIIKWNLFQMSEYNGIIDLGDGYLTGFVKSSDVTGAFKNLKYLADYCSKNNIEFSYISAPGKICKYDDKNISGIFDFSNQRADEFHKLISEYGIKNLDLRDVMHAENKNHHEMFYKTDHHWKSETGLWASRHVLKFLHDKFNWNTNYKILDPENFKFINYPKWFLGSQGRKLTLARATPDDFIMIYPKFETHLKFEVPNYGITKEGDFNITYYMPRLETKNHYEGAGRFAVYNHGRRPLIKITNYDALNNKKLLLIYDSFSNAVIPFMALGIKNINAIDLRQFDGSLINYIEQYRPDMVMILYVIGNISRVNAPEKHLDLFDFR